MRLQQSCQGQAGYSLESAYYHHSTLQRDLVLRSTYRGMSIVHVELDEFEDGLWSMSVIRVPVLWSVFRCSCSSF